MKIMPTTLEGVVIVEPVVHGDDRGFFFESFHEKKFSEAGIDARFVQTNVSRSSRGVVRGLHYQYSNPQGKLVTVLDGEVYDIAVDIRRGSRTFGQWTSAMLTANNRRQMWIPPGFAHGFCVVSDSATFMYQCTALYDAVADCSIAWNDPDLGIDWPVSEPILSAKDSRAPLLQLVSADRLPSASE